MFHSSPFLYSQWGFMDVISTLVCFIFSLDFTIFFKMRSAFIPCSGETDYSRVNPEVRKFRMNLLLWWKVVLSQYGSRVHSYITFWRFNKWRHPFAMCLVCNSIGSTDTRSTRISKTQYMRGEFLLVVFSFFTFGHGIWCFWRHCLVISLFSFNCCYQNLFFYLKMDTWKI